MEAPEVKKETIQSGLWRCSICTYDNEESMSACDICGVLRNPLVNSQINCDKRTGNKILFHISLFIFEVCSIFSRKKSLIVSFF